MINGKVTLSVVSLFMTRIRPTLTSLGVLLRWPVRQPYKKGVAAFLTAATPFYCPIEEVVPLLYLAFQIAHLVKVVSGAVNGGG